MQPKRVAVINSDGLARTFMEMGHEVLQLTLEPGPVDIVHTLAEHGFEPDVLFEAERLGPRTILLRLGECTCAKVFWSLDTHLNAWWHKYYGRLFDWVFTTQDHWVGRLQGMGLPRASWLPWFGTPRPFVPWGERKYDLSFVGRVTEHRAIRKRMTEFLAERFGMHLFDGVPFDAMMDIYAHSRIVPNEAIFHEINFRLFEAASCGCVVLNPVIGTDVAKMFEPDREVIVYSDVVDLEDKLGRLMESPQKVHDMGKRAWERLNKEHLATHRAQAILDAAEKHKGKAPSKDSDVWAWLSVYRLNEGGMFESDLAPVVANLLPYAYVPEAFAATLRALMQSGRGEEARTLVRQEAQAGGHLASFEVNLTASMVAMALDDFELARLYWVRHTRAEARVKAGVPESRLSFYMMWAGECERYWMPLRSGFFFDATRTVPDSAMECLMVAASIDPDDLGIVRRMESILARTGGGEDFRMSALSLLTLHFPEDWRMGLELGLANLRSMRMPEGLEELVVARKLAEGKGQAKRFDSVLATRSGEALVARVLRAYS